LEHTNGRFSEEYYGIYDSRSDLLSKEKDLH